VARTDGTPQPQSAGGAASYKKPNEARCRTALRGPTASGQQFPMNIREEFRDK